MAGIASTVWSSLGLIFMDPTIRDLMNKSLAQNGMGSCSGTNRTILAGETLTSIAQQHGTSVQALLAANPSIEDPDLIVEGEQLVIPAGCKDDGLGEVELPPAVKAIIDEHGGMDAVAAFLKDNLTTYTSKEGDTISSIATSHGINNALLLALNPSITNPKELPEGTTLTVPLVEDDGMGGCECCLPEWEEEEDFAGGLGDAKDVDDADADCPESDGMDDLEDEAGLGDCGGRGGGGQQQQGGNQDWRQHHLSVVNRYRAQYGAGPLVLDEALIRAAQNHANDMATHNFMSHTGSNGSNMKQRIDAAGFRGNGPWAENAHQWWTSNEEVVKSWMESPGHRANILNPQLKTFGVGYNNLNNGKKWCQVFGA